MSKLRARAAVAPLLTRLRMLLLLLLRQEERTEKQPVTLKGVPVPSSLVLITAAWSNEFEQPPIAKGKITSSRVRYSPQVHKELTGPIWRRSHQIAKQVDRRPRRVNQRRPGAMS